MIGTVREIRSRTVLLVASGAAAGAAAVAAAVPAIQGVIVWKTTRPDVPGPHDQDGVLLGNGERQAPPVSIVWLGDSLASGIGAGCKDSSFPRKAAALVGAEGRDVQLTCVARPGARAGDVLEQQVPRALELLRPGDVAVVTVGSNDVGTFTGPRRFSRRYHAILQELSGTGATIVACGLPDLGAATVMAQPLRAIMGWVGRTADRRIRRLAAHHGAHHVRIDVSPPRRTSPSVYLAADEWHPNDDTYHLWAGRVAALLNVLLVTAPA